MIYLEAITLGEVLQFVVQGPSTLLEIRLRRQPFLEARGFKCARLEASSTIMEASVLSERDCCELRNLSDETKLYVVFTAPLKGYWH